MTLDLKVCCDTDKAVVVCRCPPLLTVHVKRFQQDMRARLSKIDGAVPFPLHLDLTPFCDPKVPLNITCLQQQCSVGHYTLLAFPHAIYVGNSIPCKLLSAPGSTGVQYTYFIPADCTLSCADMV